MMIAVMFLPLSGLGHGSVDHGPLFEFALVEHDEDHGHSHDIDAEDFESLSGEADHHHADHTPEKASTPPWLGQVVMKSSSAAFTLGQDDARAGRLYAIDRPPRPSSLV
jgi:hypothetical protein